ncbi:protein of unknown function DUF214 [Spirochaeta thermophila DSM 6578]|uniref:Uncharacterized protein n=1 Tax=Winmispira thermophila (strain ATCC 700085 / DSM 6578 / Z-1203) TaxID=869211 RepID=G0GD15_WINT7|nr:ABC transporter permease [Spirochaeta thermophila]AEJ61307.1 protein of unknown function DUF214 [Spirochaeta thermophila DSM 6578]
MTFFWENIRLAFLSMMHNKGRTFLSMLGIIIGVASVIMITSLGKSATASVEEQIARAGLHVISIFPRLSEKEAVRLAVPDLVDDLSSEFPTIEQGVALQRGQFLVTYGHSSTSATVMGVPASFASMFSYEAEEGRFFSKEEDDARKQVVVLGSEVAEALFPYTDPIGKYIRIFRGQAKRFRVIGVMKSRSDTVGVSFDTSIFVPYQTYTTRLERTDNVSSYLLLVKEGEDVVELADRIENRLTQKASGNSDAFRVISPATIAEVYSETTGTLNLLLGGVAAISLIVGGIGIMNIMLVSVTERTREIGIRKALGATPLMIRGQFLLEAVALCAVGGTAGVGLGIGLGLLITSLMKWSFVLNVPAVFFAFVFSALVGIFFGFYPAYRASRLDPVQALMFE